jgi:FMN-dependent oxidoreductase (nitrilotriacetate monooxygenase family)
MSQSKHLHIGLSLAPTWQSGDAWRRADSDIEGIYTADFAVELALRAEAAHLDFVFRPDVCSINENQLDAGSGFACLDPSILLAAVSQHTSRIGLVSTVSTIWNPPYVVARQLQSLNWVSRGRIGWNIVTALQGHENFGLSAMPSADERYRRAAEFTEVVRQLWGSFPGDSVLIDREAGRYADAARVEPINHKGEHFRVRGPLNLPAFAARIPLIQAGASEAGQDFAASLADVVFAPTPDLQAAQDLRDNLSRRALLHGRNPADVRLLPGLSLYLADTREQARDVFMHTHARLDRTHKLEQIREMTGLDLTTWPDDKPVTPADLPPPPPSPASRTHSHLLRRLLARESLTVSELLRRPEVISAAHWQVIGTAEDAVESIQTWAASGAIDGFIAAPGGSVGSIAVFLEQVMPWLVELGLFRRDYQGLTFMEHLRQHTG